MAVFSKKSFISQKRILIDHVLKFTQKKIIILEIRHSSEAQLKTL